MSGAKRICRLIVKKDLNFSLKQPALEKPVVAEGKSQFFGEPKGKK
jgi:hypothetical protein